MSPNHKFVTYEEFERLAESVQNIKRRLRRMEDTVKDKDSQDTSNLDELIKNSENEFEAVETLSLSVFGKEALINSSVSGKRANSKCAAKKPLDFEKLSSVRRTLKRKFPNIKKKDVTEKIQSVQKKLRRMEKKIE